MDATTLLGQDHDTVRELFEDLDDLMPRDIGERRVLLEELRRELEIHARLEEEVFYPAVLRLADESGKDLLDEALEQHDEVKLLLDELLQLEPSDAEIGERIGELAEVIQQHVEQEENEIFPIARERLGPSGLAEVGKQLETLKDSLRTAVAVG